MDTASGLAPGRPERHRTPVEVVFDGTPQRRDQRAAIDAWSGLSLPAVTRRTRSRK